MSHDVIIIGGGAAGLVCAIECVRAGITDVLLIEKNKKLGSKLLLTGAGRCNLTNRLVTAADYPRGGDTALVDAVLARWSSEEVRRWFVERGLQLQQAHDGRIFPTTDRAQTVVRLLEMTVAELGVICRLGERVEGISVAGRGTFDVQTNRSQHRGARVVVAMGGRSHGRTGSCGEGYAIAASLGHTVVEAMPALVPLKVKLGRLHKLQGQKWCCRISLVDGDETIAASVGDVLFTNYGLSGLATLDLTARGCRTSFAGLQVALDFFPAVDGTEGLVALLEERVRRFQTRSFADVLVGLLPKKLANVLAPMAVGADYVDSAGADLAGARLRRAARLLSDLRLDVVGTAGWDQAQVTAGGVGLEEVDPLSGESLLVEDVYFIGEVLDVHGFSGGYNLHFAWASALQTARAMADALTA